MAAIAATKNANGTIVTIPANAFFEGYFLVAAAGLLGLATGWASITLEDGGTGASGPAGTMLAVVGANGQLCTPQVQIYSGSAEATLKFTLNGISAGYGSAVGMIGMV